jgi:hypothetical protein
VVNYSEIDLIIAEILLQYRFYEDQNIKILIIDDDTGKLQYQFSKIMLLEDMHQMFSKNMSLMKFKFAQNVFLLAPPLRSVLSSC